MIRVTWEEDNKPAETFTITDEVLESFEKFRMTQTTPQRAASGEYASRPKYADVKEMVVGFFTDCLIKPALSMFPPAQLAALIQRANAAQDALEQAKAATVQGMVTTAPAEPESTF